MVVNNTCLVNGMWSWVGNSIFWWPCVTWLWLPLVVHLRLIKEYLHNPTRRGFTIKHLDLHRFYKPHCDFSIPPPTFNIHTPGHAASIEACSVKTTGPLVIFHLVRQRKILWMTCVHEAYIFHTTKIISLSSVEQSLIDITTQLVLPANYIVSLNLIALLILKKLWFIVKK